MNGDGVGDDGRFRIQVEAAVQLGTAPAVNGPRPAAIGQDIQSGTGMVGDGCSTNMPVARQIDDIVDAPCHVPFHTRGDAIEDDAAAARAEPNDLVPFIRPEQPPSPYRWQVGEQSVSHGLRSSGRSCGGPGYPAAGVYRASLVVIAASDARHLPGSARSSASGRRSARTSNAQEASPDGEASDLRSA